MNTIPSNQPTLATALLDLSSQTSPGTQNPDNAALALPTDSGSTGTDSLDLSQTAAARLKAAEAQVAQQNQSSTLADSAAALTANNAAISYLNEDPGLAQAAQNGPSAASALSLL
jgi:hypothetical protein